MSVNQQTAEELITLVYRLQRQMRCLAQRTADPRGPGTALHAVMRMIGDHGEIRATELAEKLSIGTAGLSRHITELVEAGYVCRRQHPEDRRAYLISLTPAGSTAVSAEMGRRSAVLRHMLNEWSNEEALAANESLTRITETLQISIPAVKPGTIQTPNPAGEKN